ncbi:MULTISPECIES: IDEAL domain-containing protein [Bacillaceae]|uniref:IDEAL domain-containing protein n=1 Tax=Metabacillus sediminis TaxID=3117746 RepID=A0ABZ2NJT6_9BACI|nr:IDEAL domain-containing protein [Bacillus sp. SJS]KZZ84552.1 hypothetical protein AS29_010285 [Bacillus sp. SJS]
MKNKKSYAELMKSRHTMKNEAEAASMLDIYIQMILDEAGLKRKLALLETQINDALDQRNKPLFMDLSKQYADVIHCLQ